MLSKKMARMGDKAKPSGRWGTGGFAVKPFIDVWAHMCLACPDVIAGNHGLQFAPVAGSVFKQSHTKIENETREDIGSARAKSLKCKSATSRSRELKN